MYRYHTTRGNIHVNYRTLGKGTTERAGGAEGGNALVEAGNLLPYRLSKMELPSYPGQLMDKCTICTVFKERRCYVKNATLALAVRALTTRLDLIH
jgi:hypothetical protein